ncbi:MAG: N-acetyltransferase [Leptothrix sp. (in: Bacteria)]|nr:N-acetyltransferase [Leptothrix sp. (in: b-proteobacteria)]
MSDPIVIRRERPDQPEVVALLSALDAYLMSLYPPQASYILDVQALLADDVAFFVARDGARAVGTAACRRVPGGPDTGGQPYGEVKRMYVDPAQRGRRLGARLLGAVEDSLRDHGCRLSLLETGRDQHEAVALYERCGYTPRGPFGGYPDNGLSAFYGKAL